METDMLWPREENRRKGPFAPFFKKSVWIGGSYRDTDGRFDEFRRIYHKFESLGINVVHPFSVERLNKEDDFIRVDADSDTLTNNELQEYANIRLIHAEAAYFVCPNGYLGQHTEAELSVITEEAQYENDVAFYFSEPPNPRPGSQSREFIQEIAIGRVKTPEYVAAAILNNSLDYVKVPIPDYEIDHSKFA